MPQKQALQPCKLVSWCFKGELGPWRWAARGQSQGGVLGDVGTTGTPDPPSQTRAQSRAKALLLETVPKLMGRHPQGFARLGDQPAVAELSLPLQQSRCPTARDAGELLPTLHPCSPLPPGPGSAFVSAQMFVFSAADENIHYLVSCCGGGSSDLHFHS